jgi:hypothetical protein
MKEPELAGNQNWLQRDIAVARIEWQLELESIPHNDVGNGKETELPRSKMLVQRRYQHRAL